MDHIDQAIYATVHDSHISAKEIARRLGMSHQVLINKANPQSEYHKLNLREAVAIQLITGNHRIHNAVETELGRDRQESKTGLIEAVITTCREQGDVVRIIQDSLADGRFTLRERENCQKEIDEAVKALSVLREAVVTHPVKNGNPPEKT